MITAENVTDEQIRELRNESHRIFVDACNALAPSGISAAVDEMRASARARCAAILNARAIPTAHGCAFGIPKADCSACEQAKDSK